MTQTEITPGNNVVSIINEAVEIDTLSPGVIEKRIYEHFNKKRSKYPVHSNWASQLGHPCTRYLVYKRTKWELEELPSVYLMQIFEEGNQQEIAIIRLLIDCGFVVIHQQVRFWHEDLKISGHIDGKIMDPATRETKLLEIKSMNPYTFAKMETLNDLIEDDFTARYIDQLNIYMMFEQEKTSLLVMKNKSTGQIHIIEIPFDQKRAESLCEKARIINMHVDAGTLPAKINSLDVCQKCSFAKVCKPEIEFDPLMWIEDDDLLRMVTRREELNPLRKEFESLDKQFKEIVKAAKENKFIIGGFYVERTLRSRKNYDVPNEIKLEYEVQPTPYYVIKVVKIEDQIKTGEGDK
jgi:hypothetical protein